MPRRRPWSLPLTRAEKKFLAYQRAVNKRALDAFAAGDPTLLNQMRAEALELITAYRRRRWGHQRGRKHTTEARLAIARGAKITSATKQRDSRGRFAR
jgi:hypothetical protein